MSVVINYDGFELITYCTSADTEGKFRCMPELAKQIHTMPKMIELMQTVAGMECMCMTKAFIPSYGVEPVTVKCLTCECKSILAEAGIDTEGDQ